MAWPVTRSNGFALDATAWNEVVNALSLWGGNVNANGGSLSAVSAVNIATTAADLNGLLASSPALVGAGVQIGPRLVLRANSWDTANHTRDFILRPITTSNAGAGGLALLTSMDGGTLAELLRITSGGLVGIGTATPQNTLHVKGPQVVSTIQQLWEVFAGVSAALRTGSDAQPDFGSASNHDLFLMTNSIRRMIISAAGNVGIGTTAPTSPLQVVGLPTFASDAAAGTGGLTAGAFYKHSTGEVQVKL